MTKDEFIIKAAKALGDRKRLVIFKEIVRQGSLTITQAQHLINVTQPAISPVTKILIASELVDANKRGRTVHLTLNQEKMSWFIDFFTHIVKQAEIGSGKI